MTSATGVSPTPHFGKFPAAIGWVLTGFFTLFMAFDITIKLLQLPMVEEAGREMNLPSGIGLPIGIMELVIVALYLFPRTAILGGVLIAALMGGTAAVHLVHGDPWLSHTLFGPYLAVFAWGGLWLRDSQLRALFPLRETSQAHAAG